MASGKISLVIHFLHTADFLVEHEYSKLLAKAVSIQKVQSCLLLLFDYVTLAFMGFKDYQTACD